MWGVGGVARLPRRRRPLCSLLERRAGTGTAAACMRQRTCPGGSPDFAGTVHGPQRSIARKPPTGAPLPTPPRPLPPAIHLTAGPCAEATRSGPFSGGQRLLASTESPNAAKKDSICGYHHYHLQDFLGLKHYPADNTLLPIALIGFVKTWLTRMTHFRACGHPYQHIPSILTASRTLIWP
ncbi:hypothetical protein JZ751_013198 [Albula glossodonta]|uniref:Uncharacterized protein n=1 Tax=Albula glossodonta TaxID=121402 RepID=A0A8T2P585_9TELE|nr:hypothetical protein JZ751_013198 [Albula glossodonta]